MSEMDEIEVAEALVLSIKNYILHMVVKQHAEIDIDVVKVVVETRRNLQQGKKMLVLLDTRDFGCFTREAREYTSGKEVAGLDKAMAIITDSLPTKLMANFFIKFNKPQAPTKMFTSKNAALAWLETYR
jgi:hypothetical protein